MNTGFLNRRQALEATLDGLEHSSPEADDALERLSLEHLRPGALPLERDLNDRIICMLASAIGDTSERGMRRVESLLRLTWRRGNSNRLRPLFLGKFEARELRTATVRIGDETRWYVRWRMTAPILDSRFFQWFKNVNISVLRKSDSEAGNVFEEGTQILVDLQSYIVLERGLDSEPVVDFSQMRVVCTSYPPDGRTIRLGDIADEARELCQIQHRARCHAGDVPRIHPLPKIELIRGEHRGGQDGWNTYAYDLRVNGTWIASGEYEESVFDVSKEIFHSLYFSLDGCYLISVALGGEHLFNRTGAESCIKDRILIYTSSDRLNQSD